MPGYHCCGLIAGIDIEVNVERVGVPRSPRWRDPARVDVGPQIAPAPDLRPGVVQVRELADVPLALMRPQRNLVDLGRDQIPGPGIVEHDAKLGCDRIDHGVAHLDRHGAAPHDVAVATQIDEPVVHASGYETGSSKTSGISRFVFDW